MARSLARTFCRDEHGPTAMTCLLPAWILGSLPRDNVLQRPRIYRHPGLQSLRIAEESTVLGGASGQDDLHPHGVAIVD